MPFLSLNSSRHKNKKKSYLKGSRDESNKRRDLVKQKLLSADNMMEDADDYYLERRFAPMYPAHQQPVVNPMNPSRNRRTSPNYVDPSGSLRNPPRRSKSDDEVPRARNRRTTPPLPPKRSKSFDNDEDYFGINMQHSPGRINQSPGRRPRESPVSVATRRSLDEYVDSDAESSDESSCDLSSSEEFFDSREKEAERRPRRPAPRNSSAGQLRNKADGAMRPPRRVKSNRYSPQHPDRKTIERTERRDMSSRSNSGKNLIADENNIRRDRGVFRYRSGSSKDGYRSGSSKDSFDAAPTRKERSKERSNSFFRKVSRTRSGNRKHQPLSNNSDHSQGTYGTYNTKYTTQSAPEPKRGKDEIYKSALKRAKERQANKQARDYMSDERITSRPSGLGAQLSALPKANSDSEYEDEDAATESKSIFSSIIQKIENIYDDCA